MPKFVNLEKLPDKIGAILQPYLEQLVKLLGDNLITAAVYGSAASGDFSPKSSDLNLLLICRKVDLPTLKRCLKLVGKGRKQQINAPLFLTREHLDTSADVFPMEFLEFKENHLLVYGEELLSDLRVDLKNLRYQCEEQIKGKLIRIRQVYLEVGLRGKGIEALLKESLSSLMPVFKNMLRLKGLKPPVRKEEILNLLEKEFGLKKDILLEIWKDKQDDERIGGEKAETYLGRYLEEIEKLARTADRTVAS